MESKFQQSFIPKESLGTAGMSFRAGQGLGIFLLLAVIIFLISLATLGAAYFYKQTITREIAALDADLNKTREVFQLATIAEFKKLSDRLTVAAELINGHTAFSQIFYILETATLQSVYFSNFSLANYGKGFSLVLDGVAKNFSSVALQSDIFGKNQAIENPIFSSLDLDKKGNVTFNVTASVAPEALSYRESLVSVKQ